MRTDYGRALVMNNASFNTMILRNNIPLVISPGIHARAHDGFDGIQLVGFISDQNSQRLNSFSCDFEIYSVSQDDQWAKNLIHTTTGMQNASGEFTAHVSKNDLNYQLCGDETIFVTARIKRRNRVYIKSIYVNHIGVFESLFDLKNELDFVSLTGGLKP